MLSFRDYLKGNKDRGTITKLKQFHKSYPDYDYGPQNDPAPFSDANNMSAALGLGMGGENEEEINTQNLLPDSKPRDKSYEDPYSFAPANNNHGAEEPDAPQDPDTAEDDIESSAINQEPVGDEQAQDPNKQGVIRRVPNAHLVFKRETEDGGYEELWAYNVGANFKDDAKIRGHILAGTDIPIEKMQSKDGTQYYDIWTIGNVQMMNIKGLQN